MHSHFTMFFAIGNVFTFLFSNFTSVTYGPPIKVASRLDCARVCVEREGCSSFFYSSRAMTCIPSTNRHMNTTQLSAAPGYKYYIMRADCDKGWTVTSAGQCYQLVHENRNASDAQIRCAELGGFLAKTDSGADNIFIQAFHEQTSDFWIGGSDEGEEGTWVWKDGSPVSPDYWSPDQPDDYLNEDCQVQWTEGWNDKPCSLAHPFLCEK